MRSECCLVLSIFALASCFITESVGAQPPSTAVIAGWNIEGVDPIPDDRIGRIAELIRKIDPDLIVLTEVNPNDIPDKIVEHLGEDYQKPVILQQKADVVQNIAFVFKKGVEVTDSKLIDGTDLSEEPRSRRALTANVRIGEFDFVLIGVHLKSSRDRAARNQRTRQCTALSSFIDQSVAGAEKDVIVVGDYNMIPRVGNTRNDEVNFFAMDPRNYLRFVSSDFLAGQTSHISRCNPLRGNLLDGFAVSRKFTKDEYIAGSTRLISFSELNESCSSFQSNISDHRPVVSRFNVATDDD